MTSKFLFQSPPGRLACWLLAVALAAAAGLAHAQSSTVIYPTPAPPKPVRFNSKDLPAAFTKSAPTSLDDLREIQDHVAALVKQVSPAVVAVEIGNGSGSGVVISADGLVLTAGHVGEKAGRHATFTFPDGKTASGRTIGVDSDVDTGLMRITEPGPWPHVDVGELSHTKIGDWTLALGNPGGFDPNRSLVVRLGRIIQMESAEMQTDCTIYPGDSGGPLFDMSGRVIGIHRAISDYSTADNFHVPINQFFQTWREMTALPPPPASGPKAYSGLSVVDDDQGCRVTQIDEKGPAAKTKLRVGDHLLKVEGRLLQMAARFNRWVAESGPGETLELEVKRDKKIFTVPLKLQSLPQPIKK